jgi:hypothetical protein
MSSQQLYPETPSKKKDVTDEKDVFSLSGGSYSCSSSLKWIPNEFNDFDLKTDLLKEVLFPTSSSLELASVSTTVNNDRVIMLLPTVPSCIDIVTPTAPTGTGPPYPKIALDSCCHDEFFQYTIDKKAVKRFKKKKENEVVNIIINYLIEHFVCSKEQSYRVTYPAEINIRYLYQLWFNQFIGPKQVRRTHRHRHVLTYENDELTAIEVGLYRYPPHETKNLHGPVTRRYRWAEIKNDPSLSKDLVKRDCTSIRIKANGSRSRPWESMIFFFDKQQEYHLKVKQVMTKNRKRKRTTSPHQQDQASL